jgi:hypothetical protein
MSKRQELLAWFNLLDDDDSGEISIAELEDPLIALGFASSQEQVAALIATVDDDGSGEIGFEEFLRMLEAGGENVRLGCIPLTCGGGGKKREGLALEKLARASGPCPVELERVTSIHMCPTQLRLVLLGSRAAVPRPHNLVSQPPLYMRCPTVQCIDISCSLFPCHPSSTLSPLLPLSRRATPSLPHPRPPPPQNPIVKLYDNLTGSMNPTGAMSTSTLIAAYRRRILYNGLIGVRSEEVRLAAAQVQADQERRRAEGQERSAEGLRMGRKERRRVADKKRAVQAMDALDKVTGVNGWEKRRLEGEETGERGSYVGVMVCVYA